MKYFTIEELTRSGTARIHGINNVPNGEQHENLVKLVENVLDPLRERFGKPILVNSGFRCEKLNRLVGGVPTSDHLRGCAVDLDTGTKYGNKVIFDLIQKYLPFSQLIWEHGGSWVHVSYVEGKNKKQVLRIG